MSTKSTWPPTPESVSRLVGLPEDDLLEFKQAWPDLSTVPAKAEFVKHILAIANSTQEDRAGYIIFGVEDARRGGAVLGLSVQPSLETVSQILAAYTMPVPDARLHHSACGNKTIAIMGVFRNAFHPYWATRDVPGVLANNVVYIRRGSTVGTMTMAEVEVAIRQKDVRIGRPIVDVPLQAGFVEQGSLSGPRGAVVRVVNVSGEPVTSISVVVDVSLVVDPSLRCREQLVVNGTLEPGRSLESEIRLNQLHFLKDGKLVEWQAKAYFRAVDVRLHVNYRDRLGYLRTIGQELSIVS